MSTNYSRIRQQNLKIDHIFARGIRVSVHFITPSDSDILPIDRPLLNPSDHRPIFSYLKVENKVEKHPLSQIHTIPARIGNLDETCSQITYLP